MITIEYCEHGKAYTDFQAEGMARAICLIYNELKINETYHVGNESVIHAMRLMVAEKVISNEDVQFKFGDKIIKINEYGELDEYPKGFCDIVEKLMGRALKIRFENHKKKKKV